MNRRELYIRKKKQQRFRSILSIAALIIGILFVFAFFGLDTKARSSSDEQEYKYFMNYELESGDTLWSVASENYDTHYDSLEDYMDEICIINSISYETNLIAGTSLIIPYYSCEFLY